MTEAGTWDRLARAWTSIEVATSGKAAVTVETVTNAETRADRQNQALSRYSNVLRNDSFLLDGPMRT